MSRRSRARAVVLVAVVAVLGPALAGCLGEADDRPDADGPSGRAAAPGSPASPPPQVPVLVVVGHATRPAPRLAAGTASELTDGTATRWRGRRVLRATTPAAARRAVRRVERDPGLLAVVPVDAVGPTVVVARVAGRDPVRDAPQAVHVTLVGDVMPVRGVPDAAAALGPMARRLRAADLTVGNLETTLSRAGAPTQGGDSFGAGPWLLGPLRRSGFDVLSLANNHAGDFGTPALLDTVRALRRSPIRPVGAGRDLAAASRPAYVEAGGTRFALIAFNAIGETPRATAGTPGALSVRMPPRTGPLVGADLDHVTDLVRRAGRRADVVVVLPHWGTQYTHEPEPVQRRVSRALVAAGADLVVGGHPHWVQGVDVVDGVPVLHSLGNYVFDMDFMEQTLEGVVLEATFWGADLKALRLVPYAMDPVGFAPRPARGPVRDAILADVWDASTGPFAR